MKGGQYESTFLRDELAVTGWKQPAGNFVCKLVQYGMEIPVDEAEAKAYWDERLEKARKYAGTSQLLFMNGCDHQPVQKFGTGKDSQKTLSRDRVYSL